MKKFVSMFSFVMAIASVSFVSCGNDDDIDDPIVSTSEFTSVKATYSCELTEATLNVATVVASYTGEDGKTVNETISNPIWEKSVTINKPVSECDFQISVTKRADSEETVKLGLENIAINVKSYDQNGKMLSLYKRASAQVSTIEPGQIDNYFALHADEPLYEMTAAFDKKGNSLEK